MNKLVAKQRFGFTIVELLIVIVVIAILAAIAIVAYNGIQQRAEVQKIEATVLNYTKALELYRVAHGSYPAVSYSFGAICVGREEDYPAADGFEAGECYQNLNSPSNSGYADNDLHDRLAEFVQGLRDDTSLKPWVPDWSNLRARGVFIDYLDPAYLSIVYILPGNQSCVAQGSNATISSRERYLENQDVTQCILEIWQ